MSSYSKKLRGYQYLVAFFFKKKSSCNGALNEGFLYNLEIKNYTSVLKKRESCL